MGLADLPPWLIQITRLSIWLALLSLLFVPLERMFAVTPRQRPRRGVLTDLAYYFINNLLPTMLMSLPLAALAWAVHHVVPGAVLSTMAGLPLWAALAAAMVLGEIGFYWGHRACHRWPLLWRFHAVHHSAGEMDFLVHTRAHPVDMAFGHFCGLVPIYVLGLGNPDSANGSIVPVLAAVFGTVWGFFIHANIGWRLGPIEWLIASPAFHHWHHTRSGPIDRNFSSTFPWLDRAFGTLYLPSHWPEDYGVASAVPSTFAGQLLHPLRQTAAELAADSARLTTTR